MTNPANGPKINPQDYVVWMTFENDHAVLRRAVTPAGQKLLLLVLRDKSRMAAFQASAAECGMTQLGEKPIFRAMINEKGQPPVTIRKMAEILGAKPFLLKKTDLVGPNYTIRLSARQEKGAEGPTESADETDPASLEVIGLNLMGATVLRGPDGKRYLRNTHASDPQKMRIFRPEADAPGPFLLARTLRDLDTIAAGIVEMAQRGTFHRADFDRVMQAALEGWSEASDRPDPNEAQRSVMLSVIRQIGERSIENNGAFESMAQAMRIASSVNFVSSQVLSDLPGLTPSPMMAVFLRRITRDATGLDVRGNDAFLAALPRSRAEDARHQLHDLTTISPESVADQVSNILARRPENGHTALILDGVPEDEHIEHLRHTLGLSYAFEAVAEITSSVMTGIQDQPARTLMMIGVKRPEMLETLPQATLRTLNVLSADDLKTLEREALRARLRIRDFHRGIIETAAEAEADTREENIRQRPYQPLSRVSEPFTMVPIALEGATALALDRVRRDMEGRGGVDAAVSYGLGLSLEDLPQRLTAEQVDAVALRIHAAERGRGFLVADQTGIGKGRTLAAIATQEMRQNSKRILYFTESAAINARDVTRDLVGIGLRIVDAQSRAIQEGETKVCFLTSGSIYEFERMDQRTGLPMPDQIASLPLKKRNQVFTEGQWPEDADIVITTYSQFNFKEDSPKANFLDIIDENTMIVMDEAHNALNPRSNVGRNLRKMIERAGAHNIVFGTATFARSAMGLDLYRPLLPKSLDQDFFAGLTEGGEIALESFSTMLTQDGTLIRRDHDLSSIEFLVSIPDDEMMARYQAIMDRFSPVVEMMIDASTTVGEHIGRASAVQYRAARQRGLSEQAARAMSNEMNQYSIGIGAPLSMIARLAMNAIRIDQLVDATVEEIQEGRKPLITFHSTSEAILREFCKDETGRVSEELMAESANLTFRDQIHRIHESVYRIKIDGEREDARRLYPDVMEAFERVRDRINELPEDMPVSPIDALMERLEAHGYAVGEISGRSLCYRDGRIQRRQGRDRSEAIDNFNNGALDILIYNGAGATGGSYHAAPNVRDQRPRTMLEFEPPLDPIKYIQGLGRGNRYGQVAKPRVKSVVTGLTPEMRIMQQRNNKLRMLGASIDGNRAHPMLLDDVPDLLNKVGDAAARNVLLSLPSMARRLGFPEFAEEARDAEEAVGNDAVDTGVGDIKAVDSLANKVLSRSLSLSARDQNELVQRIVVEFDALIEELDSRNANRLRPKQLDGEIDIRDTELFSGEERETDDLDASAFTSPLYLMTGVHNFNEAAWNGERLMSEIEASMRLYGADGFAPWAERLMQNMSNLLRSYLPEGVQLEDALEDPVIAGRRFEARHKKITDLHWLLENMRPGIAMRFPSEWDEHAEITRVIIEVQPPRHPSMFDTPAAYRVKTISAGDASPQVTSLSRIINIHQERVHFRPGLSEGVDERFMDSFDRQALLTRRMPVQILSGNILAAIQEARKHNLGTVSLYRDCDARVHRGIVVARNKIDLTNLPVEIPDGMIAREAAIMFIGHDSPPAQQMKLYLSMDMDRSPDRSAEEDGIIVIRKTKAVFDFIALRKSNYDFFAGRPGLYEDLYGRALPAKDDVRARVGRSAAHKPVVIEFRNDEAERDRLLRILASLGDAKMVVSGSMRSIVNDATTLTNRIRDDLLRGAAGAVPAEIVQAQAHDEIDRDGQEGAQAAGQGPVAQMVQQPLPEYPGDEGFDAENMNFEI